MSIDNGMMSENEERELLADLILDVPCATASLSDCPPDRFHYEGVDEPDADEIRDAAARIRERHTNIVKNILATGKDLLMVKNKLKHGAFRQWLEAEFGWSERTAQNYMQAARVFGGMAHAVETLAPASIYKLAARNTPEAVRESVIADIDKGNTPTAKDIQGRITAAAGSRGSKKAIADHNTHDPAMAENHSGTVAVPCCDRAKHREVAAKVARNLNHHLGPRFATLAKLLDRVDPAALDVVKEEFLKIAGQSSSISTSTTTVTTRIEHQPNKATAT